ncbi:hypothetical protein AB0P21_11920 [Kribbella sp. NPDC056861]|uniref:hypothetical protein n=1 Tax=Kribbella sp. NPDC056861 TaxID=3154857 RepID=UPI0034437B9E
MVTTALDPHPDRTRWLRRSAAAAIATVVLGITGTGLAVGIVSARQADDSGGTQATPESSNSGTDDSGSSNSTDDSGLGTAQQDAPTQGGSNGS